MLQALQGSKGQLYKMKCRNMSQLYKFNAETPVMGVKLLVKLFCHLRTDAYHKLYRFSKSQLYKFNAETPVMRV